MEDKLTGLIQGALTTLGIEREDISLEHPVDLANGDFATNVALVVAKSLNKSPREVAEMIVGELEKNKIDDIEKVEIAGPGFINFYLSRNFFSQSVNDILAQGEKWGKGDLLSGKKIMIEYTDPNPFKPFHIGHLMANSIGEALSRLIESQGAHVIRANYQGDVGLHVAKAMYGMWKAGPPKDESLPASLLAQYIGECYAKGSDAYDNDPEAKKEIEDFNKKIYDRSDTQVNQVYDWGRAVTLDAFEDIYKLLGTKFDYYFFEGAVAKRGMEVVESHRDVFEESEGAIVFHGEKHDPKLHTRVFINRGGLPTYETKELGLTLEKFDLENPDESIVVTANEQNDYFRVVQQAISIMYPKIGERMEHIGHGMLRFKEGKMSSRKGNVVTGETLLHDAKERVLEKMKDRDFDDTLRNSVADDVSVAAIKYSILKQAIGGDIIYDFEKSISFDGDSGPYLQYGAIRARAVLEKGGEGSTEKVPDDVYEIEKLLYRFPTLIERASREEAPHLITGYLVDIAGAFNSFYASVPIAKEDDPFSPYKLALTRAFLTTITNGLSLLGIRVPEKM